MVLLQITLQFIAVLDYRLPIHRCALQLLDDN